MGLRSPSLVPAESQNVYLVVDDLGKYGSVFRETPTDAADLETILTDMVAGEYHSPASVICINVAEQWAEDVSEMVARRLRRLFDVQYADPPATIADFIHRHTSNDTQLKLRLV
jgi:hypothetical protein